MARYLREFGHSVTIGASNAWGVLPDDAAQGVVRVNDLRASWFLRRLLRRGKLPETGDTGVVQRPPQALLTKVLVPEFNVVTWLPAMTAAMRRWLAQEEFDCLVTTSPPESSHLVGLLLAKRRPAWVADFRDGWSFEPWREPFPTAAQRALDHWLERRVVQSADVSVGATLPIARDLEERLGASATWVPNGWDPMAEPTRRSDHNESPSPGFHSVALVYTGTLSGAWGRDPEPLLRALHAVCAEAGGETLRLFHAGHVTSDERTLIARSGASPLVEHLGALDRASALSLQRSADALLLLTSRNSSEATGKIFEYLVSGRPIVALAEGNEAARIVQETNTGITVPPDDVDAIVQALRRVASGELAREYAPRGLERYTYPAPALAMAEVIEEAIQRAAAR